MGTKQRGFTLIGVMIVVAIIAILAAIAYPSYMKYVQQSRRQQAIAALHTIQLAEEQYRANNTKYGSLEELKDAELLPAQIKQSSSAQSGFVTEDEYYMLAVTPQDASSYLIAAEAIPGTSQASDTGCTTLKMNQDQPVYDTNNKHCWGR